MDSGTRLDDSPAAPRTEQWHRVHEVVGPLAEHDAPLGLYLQGGVRGPVRVTSTGRRHLPEIPQGRRASFGSYMNAFPAAQWRVHVGATAVRLVVEVDDVAVLTMLRSDPAGRATVVEKRLLAAAVRVEIEVSIADMHEGGLVWFDLRAGAGPVHVVDAAWLVSAPPRDSGRLLLGTPTTGRVADVAANLTRIAEAPALLDVVSRVLVVDHTSTGIGGAPELTAAAARLDGRMRVIRQPNLGGSGGFSRVMHESLEESAVSAAVLLDDDIVVEPVALLRAFEFGRRTTGPVLVGLQMLDAARPGVLEAAAEQIDFRTFWWGPSDSELAGTDVATGPISRVPALHRLAHADFAGWWGCLVPVEVVRRIGYALPLFLKWDDAEYGLRAQRAGFGTVSLQGAAVWHESWRTKDDSRGWPAYFHARNRMVAALIHAPVSVRTGVLAASLLLELKQLLAHQVFAVERRHEGLLAVLDGPEALPGRLHTALPRLLALAAAAPDQRRLEPSAFPAAQEERSRLLAPRDAPTGARLGIWTVLLLLRSLVLPARRTAVPVARLPVDRGTWWVLPNYDEVLTPTADSAAYFHIRREPGRFRRSLARSARLHLRLWLAWPGLRRRYRRQATSLASAEAWSTTFAAPAASGDVVERHWAG